MFTPEAVLGAARSLYAWLARREVAVSGACLRCGACCESLCLTAEGGLITVPERFEALVREDPGFARFRITGRTPTGVLLFACNLLTDRRCGDYASRLALCRDYPRPSTWLAGHDLLPGCGFRIELRRKCERLPT
ncbi:hypothetical protein NNJEOMEG_03479 [Fundidesulfovibrio magnetotacticus]|uniref:Uncharacterized protein n=1 Tax=Fundidesulfovibrio magnetotacticus TaxID=2730080 RepID=A0A6V8LYE3_9BACT|nr:hypothetical protein [Fundidesulfovibrio magnetotacticus]GFK95611.1 hypothetical protein NNJEOMEG_03479 [Fundidesulfovibrio magnetotacticus]